MWRVFKLAARAAVWRTTFNPPLVALPSLLGWTLVLAVVRIALQYVDASSPSSFNPYGLNAVVAWLALELAVAALFVRPAGRATALSAMFVLSMITAIAITLIDLGLSFLVPIDKADGLWTGATTTHALFAVAAAWWIGGMVCVLRSLEPQSRLRLIGRAAALWLALFVVNALVPHAPVFLIRDFDIREANWWEYLHARYVADKGDDPRPSRSDIARIEKAQPALLQAEISHLAPRRPGVTGLYVIGLAGWADQDVFVKELDGALTSIARVLPINDRIVRLINHRETAARVPLANLQNLAAAVHGVGGIMDKDEDVLILLMTSHGDHSGFALQLPGVATTELTPQQIASALDTEGIKNRVVIVSACYSGIFLPPLANDNTIVMTAADDKSPSFGCAPERDWTYFGDALFKQSLQPGMDFQHAFAQARVLISGWELRDGVAPSNPQGYFGPALVGKLAPLYTSQ